MGKIKLSFLIVLLVFGAVDGLAKEIALTFDDAPTETTSHFETFARTDALIKKLRTLNVPQVMIFANACKREDSASVIRQLKQYKDNAHLIANHSCSHPRLDTAGFDVYARDVKQGDVLLTSLFSGQKYFRYPYLNEGTDEKLRDQMREWLIENQYRNGMVSVDNDDYFFSFKINQAKQQGKKIDYEAVRQLFLNHMLGAVDFYDDLALKTIGRSPKHVMLLHEMDATVMFIDSLVEELRKRGWTIISPEQAYKDPLYLEAPRNTYAGNGILAQLTLERTGHKTGYNYKKFHELEAALDRILGL
ncbi:MAG: polysaccharide deacetylase family protein [Bacteriovoracia bacterium]